MGKEKPPPWVHGQFSEFASEFLADIIALNKRRIWNLYGGRFVKQQVHRICRSWPFMFFQK
jgi:hypothetical protein